MEHITNDPANPLKVNTSHSDSRVDIEIVRFKKSCRIKSIELAWDEERAKNINTSMDQAEVLKKAEIYYLWLTS